jgi:hypothetical protein
MPPLWQLLLLGALSTVCADDAKIASMPDPPPWQLDSLMHLQLTAPETEALQLIYSVYPLTEHAGLNLTDRSVRSGILSWLVLLLPGAVR